MLNAEKVYCERRNGFSLLELIVAIAICAVLITVAALAQQWVVSKGRGTACVKNLREIAVLFQSYLSDHRYTYPLSAWRESSDDPFLFWPAAITDYSTTPGVMNPFVCPAVKNADLPLALQQRVGGHAYVSYGINRYGVSPAQGDLPTYPGFHPAVQNRMDEASQLILLVEMEDRLQPWNGWYSAAPSTVDSNWEEITRRHQSVNVLYCDGHVGQLQRKEVQNVPYRAMPWGQREYTHYR